MNDEFMSTKDRIRVDKPESRACGCDLVVMIEALQASCPGSNPGVRTSLVISIFLQG